MACLSCTAVWIVDPRTLIRVANATANSGGLTEDVMKSISRTAISLPASMLPCLAQAVRVVWPGGPIGAPPVRTDALEAHTLAHHALVDGRPRRPPSALVIRVNDCVMVVVVEVNRSEVTSPTPRETTRGGAVRPSHPRMHLSPNPDTPTQGQLELDEMDEPMNSFVFGEKDELFRYRMVGEHATQSGWTSIISRQTVQGLSASGEAGRGLPSWQQFVEQAGNAKGPFLEIAPFLFVGRILEAPAAAVYVLEGKGVARGLLISSSAAREE
ncbi:MAG: hypothetical protein WDW36_004502 [Sanguina aurantia]